MINDSLIQFSELCPIQFREPYEAEEYPEQYDYKPKMKGLFQFQFLCTNTVHEVFVKNENGHTLLAMAISPTLVSSGIYVGNCAINLTTIPEETVIYFEVWSNITMAAQSVWYIANPKQDRYLRRITYTHSENDWNMQFGALSFDFYVEGGFEPRDGRDETEAEDFLEQNMINETVYGDSYEVRPFTFGLKGYGIPNYMRVRLNRALVCDTFKIDGVEWLRTSGAKLENIAETKNGLAIYRVDLQSIKNYLQ
jgi:hypothetical protein